MELDSEQQKILDTLARYLDGTEAENTLTLLTKALNSNGGKTVLVAYGGGKDSSYVMAFIRYVQLKLLARTGETFRLRTVTNRQSNMPDGVMHNIHNTFNLLGMYSDKFVELFIVDGDRLTKLDENLPVINLPIPQAVIERDRKDLLMVGNFTCANGRRTCCDFCNFYMQKAEAHCITYGHGADLIITGDSLKELVYYKKQIDSLYKFMTGKNTGKKKFFMDYMDNMNSIAKKYARKIHGSTTYNMPKNKTAAPRLFTIYNNTAYDADSHRKLLDEYLNFEFNTGDLSFSFTETDCCAPALMAVLRGIKAEKLQGRSYADGMSEYAFQVAIPLMKDKNFPPDLIKIQENLYSSSGKINSMKQRVLDFYQNRLGISEENLVCMVYSPFAVQGKNLELYLKNEKPELISYYKNIKDAWENADVRLDKEIIRILETSSGLGFEEMQHLYKTEINDLITQFNIQDPHKKIIELPDGTYEQVSGR
jgi:hypothetical protein